MGFVGFPDLSFIGRQRAEETRQIGQGLGRLMGSYISARIEQHRREKAARAILDYFERVNRGEEPKARVTSTTEDYLAEPRTQAAPLPSIAERDLGSAPKPHAIAPTEPLDILDRPDAFDRRRFTSKQNAVNLLNARVSQPIRAEIDLPAPETGQQATFEPVTTPRFRDTPKVTTRVVQEGTRPDPARAQRFMELEALLNGLSLDQIREVQGKLAERALGLDADKPVVVGQGAVLVDPRTGRIIAQGPQNRKLHVVGGNLVDESGQVVYEGQKPKKLYTVAGNLVDESGTVIFSAPTPTRSPFFTPIGTDEETGDLLTLDTRTNTVYRITAPSGARVAPRLENPSAGERKELAEVRESLDKIAIIERLYKPGYVGAVEGKLGAIKEFLPGLASTEESTFRNAVKDLEIEVRRAATGLQMSQYEIADLMKAMPRLDLSETAFLARLRYIQEKLRNKLEEREREFGRSGVARRRGSPPPATPPANTNDPLGLR